jgi:hypothetical protein
MTWQAQAAPATAGPATDISKHLRRWLIQILKQKVHVLDKRGDVEKLREGVSSKNGRGWRGRNARDRRINTVEQGVYANLSVCHWRVFQLPLQSRTGARNLTRPSWPLSLPAAASPPQAKPSAAKGGFGGGSPRLAYSS